MKIKEFYDEYNKTNDKDTCFIKHITENYLGYLEKIALCDRVINATCYKEVLGKRVFYINRPAQYMVFVMAIIDAYTDIDMGESMVADFDFLDRYGLLDGLIANLPDGEYETLQAVLEMMIGDVMENERSLISYIDRKLDALDLNMDALADALGEVLGDAIEGSAEERDG